MKANYEGNIYNTYESKNPFVKGLMKSYFKDFDTLINPIKDEINSALEIGCGEGYVTHHIKDLGINVEGADVSEKNIVVAHNILRLKYLRDLGNTPCHLNHWSKRSFREFLEKQNLCINKLKTSTLLVNCIVRNSICKSYIRGFKLK